MMSMGSPSAPHPEFLITLIGPNSGAGSGGPGAAVRDAVTGQVIGQIPPGGAFSVRIDDAGSVVDLSAVPGIPEPERASHGPNDLAATADGSTLAYPVTSPRNWRPPPPVWPVRDHHKEEPDEAWEDHFPPAGIRIVTVATGEQMVWPRRPD
jgi:hypothetical protein